MLRETTRAFVLHSRPFKETSLILHCFTQNHGLISVNAKGIKRKNAQAKRAILQPFNLLNISFTGKSELKTLCDSELVDNQNRIETQVKAKGNALACSYYLNELILRALDEWQEYPELFSIYERTIKQVSSCDKTTLPKLLRAFEISLITFLGLSPDWVYDIDDKEIENNSKYEYITESGFRKVENLTGRNSQNILSGKTLTSIAVQDFSNIDLKEAQRITQKLIRPLIGNRPLESRKMWLQ